MTLLSLLPVPSFLTAHPFLSLPLTLLTLLLLRTLYRIYLHPLSHIPGPALHAATSLALNYHAYAGTECTYIHSLHSKYGPILRTGPTSVDIADGAALAAIYTEHGGFLKPAFYANFDIDGHKTVFSQTDPAKRAPRAKAVVSLFSTAALRSEYGRDVVNGCVERMVGRMKREARTGRPVNVLNLTRSLATDTVTEYLFGENYRGLEEEEAADGDGGIVEGHLSASGMVDSFVAVGRFFYLPTWLFPIVDRISARLWPEGEEADASMARVDDFVSHVIEVAAVAAAAATTETSTSTTSTTTTSEKQTTPNGGTYPSRLLSAGFTPSETHAQCKDLIFAGTDSTGMNLATICFLLAKHPSKYLKLRTELLSRLTTTTSADNGNTEAPDLQTIPYLRGVIKEGLRLSMANPSRLPRVVPPGGWTFKSTFLPAGTVVSCTPFELHLNSSVYDNPHEFQPERWEHPTPEMNRDSIPFGQGSRQCIARNLATAELFCAVHRLVQEDVLKSARCCQDEIEILEWFNSKVRGEKIELVWPKSEK